MTATHRSALFAHVPADVVKKHEATLQRLQQEEVEALASAQTARSLRLKSHRDAELHNLRSMCGVDMSGSYVSSKSLVTVRGSCPSR